MFSVTARTGFMIAQIVWDWAADCSRLVVLGRQRSCLQNCCASDWQRAFECRQNSVVWHGPVCTSVCVRKVPSITICILFLVYVVLSMTSLTAKTPFSIVCPSVRLSVSWPLLNQKRKSVQRSAILPSNWIAEPCPSDANVKELVSTETSCFRTR